MLHLHRYVSYPRTETEIFKEGTNLHELVAIQEAHPIWGGYAQRLSQVWSTYIGDPANHNPGIVPWGRYPW